MAGEYPTNSINASTVTNRGVFIALTAFEQMGVVDETSTPILA